MSRFNHRHKWTQRDYIVRCLSIVIVTAILVLFMPRESIRTFHYHEGGIWDYATLIAKDSFPVMKSKEQLQHEIDSVTQYYEPYFLAQPHVADSAVSNWRRTFQEELKNSTPAYYEDYIAEELRKIYSKGIISADEADIVSDPRLSSIRIITGNLSTTRHISELLSPKTAYETIINTADSTKYRRAELTRCKLNRFLSPNLLYDASVPLDFSVPMPANHSAPFRMICGMFA